MIIPFIVIIFVIAADQLSKYIIKTNMHLGQSFNFIPNILNIRYIENEGASFGILKDHRWIFMSLSSVALIFMLAAIIYLSRNKILRKKNLFINSAFGCMLGGGVGNMIDRIFNVSASRAYAEKNVKVVVDFLEFDFMDFAVFNLADTFICIGAVLLCICMFAGKYAFDIKPEKTEIIETEDIYE